MSPSPHRSLRICRLFASVAPEALTRIETRCDWRTYKAGEIVVSHLDLSRDIYFITDGTAKVLRYSVEGLPVHLRDTGPGSWFGEFCALDGKPRSATVEALKTCLVAKMSEKVFLDTLEHEPSVALALLRHMVWLVRDLTDRVYEFSTLAVNNRIQSELLRLAGAGESSGHTALITPAPTHADIASRVSTHREAVTREISRLSKLGLVKQSRNCLEICDIGRLKRLVDDAIGEA